MFNVVILAGSSKKGELEEQEKVNNKSFIMINGRPMLGIILHTLQKVDAIKKIVIVGAVSELEAMRESGGYVYDIVPQKETFLDNIAAGMQQLDAKTPCIVLSADAPLITKEAVEDFIARCSPYDSDFYYPIIHRDNCEEKFPRVERTYMRTKDGTFTGGNMMMVKPEWIINKIDDINIYLSYRKRPWKLVQTLPLFLIFKYLIRQITLKEVEDYLSRLFDIKASTVITPYAEIGVDVDKPSDLELVKEVLSLEDIT